MPLKTVGALMMLDGVLSAASVLPMLDTFAYRSFRDQSLFVAHVLIGALLLLSGRLLLRKDEIGTSSGANESRSRFRSRFLPVATLVAALVVAVIEATRFDWPVLVLRIGYTAFALAVLYRTTLPKT
jgi:hypothetical protein